MFSLDAVEQMKEKLNVPTFQKAVGKIAEHRKKDQMKQKRELLCPHHFSPLIYVNTIVSDQDQFLYHSIKNVGLYVCVGVHV